MLGQDTMMGCEGVKQVHSIHHDQTGPSLLVAGLALGHSLRAAQHRLHLLNSFLYLALQISHCALDPVQHMLCCCPCLAVHNMPSYMIYHPVSDVQGAVTMDMYAMLHTNISIIQLFL